MGEINTLLCNPCKAELDPQVKENPIIPGGVLSSHYIGMTATSIHSRLLSHIQSHRS